MRLRAIGGKAQVVIHRPVPAFPALHPLDQLRIVRGEFLRQRPGPIDQRARGRPHPVLPLGALSRREDLRDRLLPEQPPGLQADRHLLRGPGQLGPEPVQRAGLQVLVMRAPGAAGIRRQRGIAGIGGAAQPDLVLVLVQGAIGGNAGCAAAPPPPRSRRAHR